MLWISVGAKPGPGAPPPPVPEAGKLGISCLWLFPFRSLGKDEKWEGLNAADLRCEETLVAAALAEVLVRSGTLFEAAAPESDGPEAFMYGREPLPEWAGASAGGFWG